MTFPNSGALDYIPDGAVFWAKVGQRDIPVSTDTGLFGDRIGQPFAVFDHLNGADVPDNSGTVKYIKLTAGEDGVGGFNEGLLTNETTIGSGPTVEITAEIATGPIAGAIVHLINSENRHIAPGENSGATHNDQIQDHNHAFVDPWEQRLVNPNFTTDTGSSSSSRIKFGGSDTGNDANSRLIADAVDDTYGNGGTLRKSDKTDVKRIEATHYMRIV